MRVNDVPKQAAENSVVFDSYVKAQSVLRKAENPYCSISGGSDSDVMLDIMVRLDADKIMKYVWFNTGMEYKATKKHLDFLEQKYGVTIERMPPVKPVPFCVHTYGIPFVSKTVSEMISRLQRHGFDFRNSDGSYGDLVQKYPKCRSALRWWTNTYGDNSMFNIRRNSWLKEFLMENPPDFPVSNKCCNYAKKATGHKVQKDYDLSVVGVRKAEGGVRSARYTNCYTQKDDTSEYRPLFWYSDDDKAEYNRLFNIKNSDCYEVWGLKRTGCVGCPYGLNISQELDVVKQYEPNMYKACMKVFGQSYEYTAAYREFQKEMKSKMG